MKELIITANTRQEAIAKICNEPNYPQGDVIITITKAGKSRTLTQNKALHLWFDMLACALNDAGFDQVKVIDIMEDGIDIPWSKETVKQILYKPILEAMTNKTSTSEMDTVEPSKVYDTLSRWLVTKGLPAPQFPDRFGS